MNSDGITGKRFVAAYWDPSLPVSAALEKAVAPIAWSALGEQTIFPPNYVQRT